MRKIHRGRQRRPLGFTLGIERCEPRQPCAADAHVGLVLPVMAAPPLGLSVASPPAAADTGAAAESPLAGGPRSAAVVGEATTFTYLPPFPMPAPPVPIFQDPDLTFQTLFALGNISAGSGDYGEITSVIERVRERGEGYRAFFEEFVAEARRVRGSADEAARRGDRVTALGGYLRSSAYFSQALYFALSRSSEAELTAMAAGGPVPESSRALERETYREMRAAWENAGRQMRPVMQVVRIPTGRSMGPVQGWFLRAANDGRQRPTLIMNNGSDAQAIDLWGAGASAALKRGWNVLIFDGPGQGSMLFERNRTFIPKWEKVITPIVSWLQRRGDVDPRRIVLSGSSFGGCLVPIAAAKEPRLAAISLDPAVVYAGSTWTDSLGPQLLELFERGDRDTFNAAWTGYVAGQSLHKKILLAKRLEIYAGATMFDKYAQIIRFDNREVLSRIRCPVLVLDNEVEQFFPGQPEILHGLLTGSRDRRYVKFTIAEGAQYHCEPMAPERRNGVVMDFFERVTRGR